MDMSDQHSTGRTMPPEGISETRAQALAMIAAWVHDEAEIPLTVLERIPAAPRLADAVTRERRPNLRDVEQLLAAYESNILLARELSLISAALLHCWGITSGIPAPTLLADIALDQAINPG